MDYVGINFLLNQYEGVPIKPESATVDSCFVLIGTRKYGVSNKNIPPIRMIYLRSKAVTQYRMNRYSSNDKMKCLRLQILDIWI